MVMMAPRTGLYAVVNVLLLEQKPVGAIFDFLRFMDVGGGRKLRHMAH
jgi:hypothetical protein